MSKLTTEKPYYDQLFDAKQKAIKAAAFYAYTLNRLLTEWQDPEAVVTNRKKSEAIVQCQAALEKFKAKIREANQPEKDAQFLGAAFDELMALRRISPILQLPEYKSYSSLQVAFKNAELARIQAEIDFDIFMHVFLQVMLFVAVLGGLATLATAAGTVAVTAPLWPISLALLIGTTVITGENVELAARRKTNSDAKDCIADQVVVDASELDALLAGTAPVEAKKVSQWSVYSMFWSQSAENDREMITPVAQEVVEPSAPAKNI